MLHLSDQLLFEIRAPDLSPHQSPDQSPDRSLIRVLAVRTCSQQFDVRYKVFVFDILWLNELYWTRLYVAAARSCSSKQGDENMSCDKEKLNHTVSVSDR